MSFVCTTLPGCIFAFDSFLCNSGFLLFRFYSTFSATACRLIMLRAYSFARFSCFGEREASYSVRSLDSLLEMTLSFFWILTIGLLTTLKSSVCSCMDSLYMALM